MKISIITVCYNSEKSIQATIASVLEQTYANIEYIVVDGSSTDRTLDIIKEYEPKFNGRMRWVSEPDEGIYDAMNKGIAMALGEIVGILNSDDVYTSADVIADIMRHFAVQQCDAVYGDLVYVDAENTAKIKRYWQAGQYKKQLFKYGWMPPHPTFFVKKEIYATCGMFRTDFRSAADYEFMLRVIHKAQITLAYIPKILVTMRTGGASNANLHSRYRNNKEDRKAWKVNQLKPYFFTLMLKPVRKIPQYFIRPHNHSLRRIDGSAALTAIRQYHLRVGMRWSIKIEVFHL
jgi:glycosyltransferase involved in cell wall biosynthesis